MNTAKRRRRQRAKRSRYAPAFWPTWLGVGVGWIVARLPLSVIFTLGRVLGWCMYRLARGRRRVTETNIARCFPELDPAEQRAMVARVFEQVGIGAVEQTLPWLNPKRNLSSHFRIEGLEHLQNAVARGRGVLLIGAHYATLDVISQGLSECGPIDLMYRYNKNPVLEWLQVRGRKHFFDGVVEREDARQVLRRLKQGRVIWYAADQDYGRKHSVFAPFFGVPAATIVATSRFARLNNSPVLLLRQTRDLAARCWVISFSPEVDGFPSDDDERDAARMNSLLEAQIRLFPDQYLWLHKRFKTQPEGAPRFYPEGC